MNLGDLGAEVIKVERPGKVCLLAMVRMCASLANDYLCIWNCCLPVYLRLLTTICFVVMLWDVYYGLRM